MKVMHNPPLDVRIKIEKYLEKAGKELVNFVYGTADKDERRFYVGIAYTPRNSNEGDSSSPNCYDENRYDVVVYDNETDSFEYSSICLKYENALIHMGQLIRKTTYENK